MLAIIFTGGLAPPVHVIKVIMQEASSNPLFIAADSGLLSAESAGLQPDWVVGDMDSLNDDAKLASLPPQRILRTEHDKDFTDTEMAFALAIDQGCNDFWIIGGGGGRIDHLFGIRSLFERDIFPGRWITDSADIWCIDSGQQSKSGHFGKSEIKHSLEIGAVVSVFPLGGDPWKAKSTGLKWPLDTVVWDRGFFGLSNVAVDDKFSIKAESGRFMVILPLPQL